MLTASTPAVVQAAWHRTVVDTGFVDVTVVTGANSGVGYGVAERLVEKALMAGQGSQRVIVMACRNKRKAEDARERLLEDVARRRRKTSAARGPIPETLVQLLIVDLADTGSVFRACAEFKERFQRLDTIHLNAGILPTAGINLLTGLKNLVTRPSFVAQTGGDVFVQPRGTTTHEGLGTVFAANAFGHYILTMELRDVMTDGAKILWYTSTTASAVRHLDIEDLQCIKGDHPYESSKSVCEILASAPPSVAESESKKAYSFVVSPGNCASGLLDEGSFIGYAIVVVVWLFRLLHVSGSNISPRNGATAPLYVTDVTDPEGFDRTVVYHSETSPMGRCWVRRIPIVDHVEQKQAIRVREEVRALYLAFKERASREFVLGR